jgi:hypothetical protein
MGIFRDFFAGYAHGSNKAGQDRIERKIDDLSKKVDNLKSSAPTESNNSQPKSASTGSDSYKVFVNCYNAHRRSGVSHNEAVVKASTEQAMYDHNKSKSK